MTVKNNERGFQKQVKELKISDTKCKHVHFRINEKYKQEYWLLKYFKEEMSVSIRCRLTWR